MSKRAKNTPTTVSNGMFSTIGSKKTTGIIYSTNIFGQRTMLYEDHQKEMKHMRETITARDKALATRNQTISHLTQHLTEVKNTASAAYQELEQRYLDLQERYDSALEEVDEQKYECDLVRQELANEREWTRQLKAAFEEQYDENQYNRQLANELLDRELQRHRDNQEFLHSIENMTQAEYEAYVDALAGYQPTAPTQQNGYASDEDDPYDYPEEDYDY